MKSSYVIDLANNRVDDTHRGSISVDDIIAHIEVIIADTQYQPGMDAICDYSQASTVWSLSEIDRFRKYLIKVGPRLGHVRWAAIFPKGKDTTTARILIALQNAFNTQVKIGIVRSRAEAIEWLKKFKVTVVSS